MTIITPPDNVIAVQTAMSFEHTLDCIRAELPRREFRILSEVNLARELDRRIGISTPLYVVLIVWHPFSAYQALLSDPNGGLMVPFNVAVYQNGEATIVSALQQPVLKPEGSIGIRVLGQELNRRMRDVLLHLGTHERASERRSQVDATERR